MNGWQLFTLLVVLLNSGLLVYWQRANEKRMDLHWKRLQALQAQIKDLLPLLTHVSRRLEGTDIGNSEFETDK